MEPLLSKSWLDLKPNTLKNLNKESFDDYIERIRLTPEFGHIPNSVLEQWIHPHHNLHQTIKNYAWINYYNVEFTLEKFTTNDLFEIYVIEDFQDLIQTRIEQSKNIENFFCTKVDKECWKTEGSWRTPPIILNCKSIKDKPNWTEISTHYQLIEGHNRLGYLKALKEINLMPKLEIKEFHNVWLLSLV